MKRIFSAVAGTMLLATAAGASSITVTTLDATAHNVNFGAAPNIGEDFEALGALMGEGEVGASLLTAVGSITHIAGGTGSGGTVSNLSGNTGTQLALRDGNVYGRDNTTPGTGAWFLDSNDTFGMVWDVALAGSQAFNSLSFTLSDASDTGAYLRVESEGMTYETRTGGKLGNGNELLVTIDFGQAVTSAEVILGNFTSSGGDKRKLNDGFSIDGLQVAAVPVPASVLLFGTAFAGFGVIARRKKKAANA
ncbi:MAG: VPLPA-CTERM sorting domain-containing protein [Pseudomonadota bacterium]